MFDKLQQWLLDLPNKKKWTWKVCLILIVVVLVLVLYAMPNFENFVLSIGQKGGQTAHTIINSKPSDRHLNDEIKEELEKNLPSNKDGTVVVASAEGDWEADQFAAEVSNYLKELGWKQVFRFYQGGAPLEPGISFGKWSEWPAVQIGKNE